MPKGGDLHHNYFGAVCAEQYLEWVDRNNYCINKNGYRIETGKEVVEAERAKAAGQRGYLSGAEVVADNNVYRALLQRWLIKDLASDGAFQAPPDQGFFDTFGYFNPVTSSNSNQGLLLL